MQFTKNLNRFRLVTFDITDTLLEFKDAPEKIYAKTAKEFGYHNIDEDQLRICFRQQFKAMTEKYPNFGSKIKDMSWQQWWHELVKKTFHCTNPNIDYKNINQLAEHLLKIFRTKECWLRIDCGEKLVQKVRESGVTVGCISNFDPSLRSVLHEMNILQYFDFVLTSYEATFQKPDREIFNLALKQVGNVEANEALHIGNSFELDFMGARKAGWSSLLVTRNQANKAVEKKNFSYKNICDMLKALETENIKW